jgi:hypothetical protein
MKMADEVGPYPSWLHFNPHIIQDPGPEVYRMLAELPAERQRPIVAAINAARGELEAARAKGYSQIGAALAGAASAGAAKP